MIVAIGFSVELAGTKTGLWVYKDESVWYLKPYVLCISLLHILGYSMPVFMALLIIASKCPTHS
ncbi:MAG: hypothetical protein DJ555_00770 [Desulfurococcaceae archaeon]|nr:MAG: hypothetical protein DJ555_00770 [Desulfurococcaceae archaeon]